jgi:cytochrome oxidase Cu insertion factor (SCO1/SenC/PrrC family)
MQLSRWTKIMVPTLLGVALLLVASHPAPALQAGDKAPDFSLPATTSEKVSLDDFVGKKAVVLFFYVYAFTNT